MKTSIITGKNNDDFCIELLKLRTKKGTPQKGANICVSVVKWYCKMVQTVVRRISSREQDSDLSLRETLN